MAASHLHLGEVDAARESLRKVAGQEREPLGRLCTALLGQLVSACAHDDAIQWWNAVDAAARSRWGLDEPLRQTVLVRA